MNTPLVWRIRRFGLSGALFNDIQLNQAGGNEHGRAIDVFSIIRAYSPFFLPIIQIIEKNWQKSRLFLFGLDNNIFQR